MCALQYMKITGYKDENYSQKISGDPYSCMINPETVSWKRTIEYAETQPPDSSTPSQRYKYSPGDSLSFDIVIDCTGVVDSSRLNMKNEIAALENIVFTFNGDIHRPNFVVLQWGQNFTFKGVLNNFDTNYTLFNSDGNALRAKISMTFTQFVAPETRKKKEKKNSPDVSHLVTVEEGMNLPQLCNQVWQNSNYAVQVARYNGLNKFRNLKGIKTLIFPPIIQPA
jgi:hypothetical protein